MCRTMAELNASDLRDFFDRVSSQVGYDTTGPSAQSQTASTSNRTVLDTLTGGQNFSVSSTSIQHVASSQAKAGINMNAAAGAATAVKSNIQANMGAISNVIRSAQAEVRQAMRDTGNQGSGLFADQRMGGTAAGLVVQAASDVVVGGLNGMGSAVTALAKGSTGMDTLMADLKGKKGTDRKQAINEIKDRLQKSASPTQGIDMPSADSKPVPKSQFDWNAFFDAGHDLEEFMAIDPDNPHQLPEFRALRDMNNAVDHELNNIAHVKHDVEVEKSDMEWNVQNASDTLVAINGAQVPAAVALQPNDKIQEALATLNNEPPRRPENDLTASATMAFSA